MRWFVILCLAVVGLIHPVVSKGVIAQNANRIEGTVWDQNNQPVADVYVELLNSMEGDLARSRTTGSGRFMFGGLTTGRFALRVITTGTNFLEEAQDVEIVGTGMRGSTEIKYVEFRLKPDPRKITLGSGGPAESVFVQDVSDSARTLYKKGLAEIKTDKGLKLVEDAITAFPDYFDALAAAGKEYVERGDYQKGAVYLVRAAKVNARSYSVYSSLSYAAYKLNKLPEALEAARLSVTIEPKAINTRVLMCRLLRLTGNLKLAESFLLETMKMAPNMPQVYYELALVHNRQNRNAEAAEELAHYLKLAPNDPDRKSVEELIAKLKGSPPISNFAN
jgi:Flp pilus assembly protein TadD